MSRESVVAATKDCFTQYSVSLAATTNRNSSRVHYVSDARQQKLRQLNIHCWRLLIASNYRTDFMFLANGPIDFCSGSYEFNINGTIRYKLTISQLKFTTEISNKNAIFWTQNGISLLTFVPKKQNSNVHRQPCKTISPTSLATYTLQRRRETQGNQ